MKILEEKIKELEKEINYRNTEEWLNSDGNEYMWVFGGVKETYNGRLEGLKEAFELIKRN